MCGNKMVKNQQCWRTDVSCGEVCGKLLRCGSHRCRKTCHRATECEDALKACQQVCGKLRKACGHACEEACHAPYSCPDDRPCQHKILVTCACQHLKKEVRCGASKHGPGHLREKLVCDDECARLERNRKLALALNIDQDTHKDDHVPYSKTSLEHYANNPKWAQAQERAFRAFAVDETRRQLRFKPMQAHLRAFLHALAEDFGFDSESLDPEPHRHVVVLKTPRFVMAPMKTLAQCADIRASARASAATAATTATDAHFGLKTSHGGGNGGSSSASGEPANALLLLRPRFALTLEELHRHLDAVLTNANKPAAGFSIDFLPSEDVVLRLKSTSTSSGTTELELESLLRSIHASVNKAVAAHSLAGGVVCCRVDASLNVLWRDTDAASNGSSRSSGGNGSSSSSKHHGWNTVAAKAGSAPRTVLAPARSEVGEKSVFTVLGSRARREAASQQQQRREDADIVEDWEQAEEEEEKRELIV
jgi:transcriptional repressor NF-X1